MLKVERKGDLYLIKEEDQQESTAQVSTSIALQKWHKKLGHLNEHNLKMASKNRCLQGLDLNLNEKLNNCEECEVCIKSKSVQLPFPTEKDKSFCSRNCS